jgi:hypothetical protein
MNQLKVSFLNLSFATVILMPVFLALACTPSPESATMQTGARDIRKSAVAPAAAASPQAKAFAISSSVRAAIENLSAGKSVEVRSQSGRVTKLAGNLGVTGISPANAFQQFIVKHREVLDVPENQIAPGHWRSTKAESIPLMYDKTSGTYRFTLTRHHQTKNGIPVFRSRIDVLTQNKTNQIVEIVAQTKNLDSFVPSLNSNAINSGNLTAALATIRADKRHEQKAKDATTPTLRAFSDPSLTIWAGSDGEDADPTLAITFTGSNDNRQNLPEEFLFVADAATGDILYKESLIVHEDITGNVTANVVDGVNPQTCDPVAEAAMAGAIITSASGASVFTGADGTFTVPNAGTDPILLTSAVKGRHFAVYDSLSSRDDVLTQTVTPPGPTSFTHAQSLSEYLVAQTNGYHQSVVVRNWLLQYHPSYPVIANQTNFPVHVNLTSGYCPGNAWYDGSSVNYCASGSTYPNTAFGSVAHHEYGHHIVSSGGSGQDEYGEGMADTVAMLIADDSGLAYGFTGDCSVPLRNADNDCQYLASGCSTCGSEVHSCGKLLAGIMWDIRTELTATEPTSYIDILSALAINSVLLHSGTAIDAGIAVDLLTLDDVDGNIGNGTPHRTEICNGFAAHGLECPALEQGLAVLPESGFEIHGDPGGPFSPDSVTYELENMGPGSMIFLASTNVEWLDVSMPYGSLAEGERTSLDVTVTEAANVLPDGTYEGEVTFVNKTTHAGDVSLPVTLVVGGPKPIYTWTLDSDPGWTMDTGWEFGAPIGSGTDPGNAPTGVNIYGTNLQGNYSNDMSAHSLTTGAIDCSALSQVSLRYQRWLGVETRTYDRAEISVSTDGITFTPVWQNPFSTLNENSWTLQEIDLSSIADGESSVYLRWTLGPTDGSVVFGGWNLDDIEIWGIAESQPVCSTDEQCDDELYCNGLESCSDEGICVPGAPVVCDDAVDCTLDACNETTDSCEYQPRNTLCNDGLFCNGEETCSPEGCVMGTPVVCDDEISCTDDACNEESDSCDFVPDNSLCDDGAFCNGAEVCGAEGCTSGVAPCDDGLNCTDDACNESLQSCEYTPDNSVCDNGLFCDGEETCEVNAGCVSGTPPCAELCDEDYHTCISCSDEMQNGAETDIDCGGGYCDACVDGLSCAVDTDCQSGNCEAGVCQTQSGKDATAELLVTTDWGAGYCADMTVTNNAATATTSWKVTINVSSAQIYTLWNAAYTTNTGVVELTPIGWNDQIGAGQTQNTVGFCVNRTGSEPVATVIETTAQY